MMCGGFNKADVEEQDIELLNSLKDAINQKLGKSFESFKILELESQVVAGMNFLYTVEANDGSKFKAKIHRPLPHTNQPPSIMEAELI